MGYPLYMLLVAVHPCAQVPPDSATLRDTDWVAHGHGQKRPCLAPYGEICEEQGHGEIAALWQSLRLVAFREANVSSLAVPAMP